MIFRVFVISILFAQKSIAGNSLFFNYKLPCFSLLVSKQIGSYKFEINFRRIFLIAPSWKLLKILPEDEARKARN